MSENHVIPVVFNATQTIRTRVVYQYDYGQELHFVNFQGLPNVFEVHFSNSKTGEATIQIGTDNRVVVPDIYLTNPSMCYAWVFLHDTDTDGETKYVIEIPIQQKAQGVDGEVTPVQQSTVTQAIAVLNEAVEQTSLAQESAEAARDAAESAAESVHIPTNVSAFTNDAGYLTAHQDISNKADKDEIPTNISQLENDSGYLTSETDPTVPAWAKQAQKPTYTAAEVGATTQQDVSNMIADTVGDDVSNMKTGKADKADTVLDTTLSHGRKENTTVGTSSVAYGQAVEASGTNSHAQGRLTKASGMDSHAEGHGSVASGLGSHAEGVGGYSGATLIGSIASGSGSHAEGAWTEASGYYAHSEGQGTIANHKSQHVAGEYNVADPSSSAVTSRGKYAEIVGNGTSNAARSNARTLDWSGNETLTGTLTCSKSITIGSTTITEAQLQSLLAMLT